MGSIDLSTQIARKHLMTNRSPSPNVDLEGLLNGLIQKMFPAWYACQAAKEAHLGNLGVLNPHSFLSHRWLSLHAVFSDAGKSLIEAGEEWKPLCGLLEKLISERETNSNEKDKRTSTNHSNTKLETRQHKKNHRKAEKPPPKRRRTKAKK